MMLSHKDLELMVALSQHKNFGKAALHCRLSQPALSLRLKKMEKITQAPLVMRGSSFRGFTREGDLVLNWAHKLLADSESMRQEIQALKNIIDGRLVLGIFPTAMPFATKISTELRRKNPCLSIEIHSLKSDEILKKLEKCTLDAGLMPIENSDDSFTDFLYEEHYILIAPQTLVKTRKSHLKWEDAARLPLCLLTNERQIKQRIFDIFAEVNTNPNVVVEANDLAAVMAQVTNGNAATILPFSSANYLTEMNSLITFNLIEPVVTEKIGLMFNDHSALRPIALELKEIINKLL
tara:strand:+ start:244 stop:1125 length:882 start_codon:yes stop_codon:yes gene_type:complete